MAPLIELKGIVNSFGPQTVHDGVDMTLEQGEILGLVGSSGSGKSVLLRTILGLRKQQAGDIFINGTNVEDSSLGYKQELHKEWGVVFQNGALFSGLTVLDNIALPLREHTDLPEDMIQDLVFTKLKMVGLQSDVAYKLPSELSGGMAKRAALARALAMDPRILFLDEPTAGLDPISAAAVDSLILSLRDTLGLSVLIITHDLDTLVTICDRIAVLVDKKATIGNLDDMLNASHPWIQDYFNGPRMSAARAQHASQVVGA